MEAKDAPNTYSDEVLPFTLTPKWHKFLFIGEASQPIHGEHVSHMEDKRLD